MIFSLAILTALAGACGLPLWVTLLRRKLRNNRQLRLYRQHLSDNATIKPCTR